jgi:hypothetical protein
MSGRFLHVLCVDKGLEAADASHIEMSQNVRQETCNNPHFHKRRPQSSPYAQHLPAGDEPIDRWAYTPK